MKLSIVPLEDKIIVEKIKASNISAGGVHLPAGAQEKTSRGTVMGVGRGKMFESGELRKPQVNEGDIVIFLPNSGIELTVDGKVYLIMRELDIMAVVRGNI